MDMIFQNENFILLIIVIIGLLILIWQLFLLFKIFFCFYWNKTDGKVISSNLKVIENTGEVDKSYRAKIKYQYLVNKDTFVSSRVYYGDKLSSSFKSRYAKLLEKYPVGEKVKVYYNPISAKESVIERGVMLEVVFMLIVSLSAIIIGLNFHDFSVIKQML